MFAIVFVPTMVLGWMLVTNALRIRGVRRAYLNMPVEVREQILNRIHEAGRDGAGCSVLVATEPGRSPDDIAGSHYGGIPYAEAGDDWPAREAGMPDPANFMIQVRLDDSFPPPWPGRLVVVFNRHDVDQTVRCYPLPSAETARGPRAPQDQQPQREWTLRCIRIPRQPALDDAAPGEKVRGGLLDYDPVVLLESLPELSEQLSPFTRRPADLLAAILAPNHCGYGFELSDIVQLGGEPVWLKDNLGGLNCDQCGRSMRFLFQFGDLNGGRLLGDGGVCYAFGCDEHPDQPRAIVQMG